MGNAFGKNLKHVVNEMNAMGAIYGPKMRSRINVNKPEHRVEIRNYIDSGLSPENLSMDGEASAEWVEKRGAFLERAKDELEAYYAD